MKLLLNTFFIFFFMLPFALCLAAENMPQTPQECLNAMQNAIDNADGEAFATLCDTRQIINFGIDTAIELAGQKKIDLPPLPAMVLGAASKDPKGREIFITAANAFILEGINSGAFAGKKSQTGYSNSILAPLFSEVSTGRKQITHIGESKKNGSFWLVPFMLKDYGNGNSYSVTGKFAMENNFCRLKNIENIDELILKMADEQQ